MASSKPWSGERSPIVVLVVEDDLLVRLGIADTLTDEGFVVFEAGNALEASDILRANPSIEIMFTDVDMPGEMDGLELTAAVKQLWPLVHIIVTSGMRGMSAERVLPPALYLPKPCNPDTVIRAMRQLVA